MTSPVTQGVEHVGLTVIDLNASTAFFEDAPEKSGNGPKEHFMVYEPGGNRLELSYDPR